MVKRISKTARIERDARIRQLRREQHLTIKQLMARFGLCRGTVRRAIGKEEK